MFSDAHSNCLNKKIQCSLTGQTTTFQTFFACSEALKTNETVLKHHHEISSLVPSTLHNNPIHEIFDVVTSFPSKPLRLVWYHITAPDFRRLLANSSHWSKKCLFPCTLAWTTSTHLKQIPSSAGRTFLTSLYYPPPVWQIDLFTPPYILIRLDRKLTTS